IGVGAIAHSPASRLAAIGFLHLDHVSPEPGQRLGAGRSRLELGEIEHLDPLERRLGPGRDPWMHYLFLHGDPPAMEPRRQSPRAPDVSFDQLCQANSCALRAEPCEITTLTSAGPRKFIASSRALRISFGFSTSRPLPPKASITRS